MPEFDDEDEAVRATYLIESAGDLRGAADAIAGEQSSGSFTKLPGETQELQRLHRAQVLQFEDFGTADRPSLPTRGHPSGPVRRGRVVIEFPMRNIGTSFSALVTAVAGNLFELAQLSGIRLLDLEIPPTFCSAQPETRFGVEGTRLAVDAHGPPLIGTIIKPSIGLRPEQTAQMVRDLVRAEIDFIKDDELMEDPPSAPFADRLHSVQTALDEESQRRGRPAMYAFNISGDVETMLRRHDMVADAGGSAVMVNINQVGFAALRYLRSKTHLPIHGHRAGWGMLSRCPSLGISFPAYQKLWRLCGVDHLHVGGLQGKFSESDATVTQSIGACLKEIDKRHSDVLPVVSSAQWAGTMPATVNAAGGADFLFLAGGGIVAHPNGIAGGVESIRDAYAAAVRGESLQTRPQPHRTWPPPLTTSGRNEHH